MSLIPSSSVYQSPACEILLLSVCRRGNSVNRDVSDESTTMPGGHFCEHVKVVIIHQ
jgi:hypothetical protein